MLVGDTEESKTVNGRTEATASWLTTENCTVSDGDWVNYTYCQFSNEQNSGRNYPWVRVQAGLSNSAYSNPRYGHPNDVNNQPVVDENHEHMEDDMCGITLVFNQLYGGGQGCYGGNEHLTKGVTVMDAPEKVQKFEARYADGFKIKTGTTVRLSDLFTAIEGRDIQSAYVYAFVSPVSEEDTVRATFDDSSKNWIFRTLTFTGRGHAIITIQDYYYCETTTLQIYIPEPGAYIIVDHQILGQWENDRVEEGNRDWGAQLTYDLNESTWWNPKASNDSNGEKPTYYSSGEGILYTLDQAHDVNVIQLTFGGLEYYFDLYVSANGVDFDCIEQVRSDNYTQFYNEYVATFEGPYTNVKYIKVLFTGSARDAEGNLKVWVTMKEISLSVEKPTVEAVDAENAKIIGHEIVGTWADDYGTSNSLGPHKSYDGNAVDSYWQGRVPNYTSGAGIIYELDGAYDLKQIIVTQHQRPYFFELYVSADGETYLPVASITAANAAEYFDGLVATTNNLTNTSVVYIKVMFTGTETDSSYINLFEVVALGK